MGKYKVGDKVSLRSKFDGDILGIIDEIKEFPGAQYTMYYIKPLNDKEGLKRELKRRWYHEEDLMEAFIDTSEEESLDAFVPSHAEMTADIEGSVNDTVSELNHAEENEKGYEQKYKQALEIAKRVQANSNGMILKKWLWKIFPELKENEDEKTRKELIQFIGCMHDGDSRKKVWLDWLEKQVSNEAAEKEKSVYVFGQFLYCKGSFNEFKEGESYWLEYIGNDTYIGRSDNILNQKFHITPRQLYTWFDQRHPDII